MTPRTWTLGIPDEEFHQRKPLLGLITKLQGGVVALARVGLRDDSVVWDVGAGSGSISIEAALLAPRGRVFAIEKAPEDCENVRLNVAKFATANVEVWEALAPDCFSGLPDPDAVFVGGSAGRMAAILEQSASRLRPEGRLVVDAATIENLAETVSCLKGLGMAFDVTLLAAARSKELIGLTRFEALNPVFIVAARRAGPHPDPLPEGEGTPHHSPRGPL